MKQRTFLYVFLSFLSGMGVAYGLIYLDRQAVAPRLQGTDVFEVVQPDGTVLRLSYAEIEREREELRDLRERLQGLERNSPRRRGGDGPPLSPLPAVPPGGRPSQEDARMSAGTPGAKGPRPPDENLKDLFAKIFSQPIMQDLIQAQITREAGELEDVLDLTEEQLAKLEQALRKRKKNLPRGIEGTPSGPTKDEAGPQGTLQEELQSILTPEQYHKYREYTEKKNALIGTPALDRQLFELNWRLKLTEEQETPVREILKEQEEKLGHLSPASATEGDASSAERLERHLQQRTDLNRETADRMKTTLDEEQYEAFLKYQLERDTETRLLRRLIQEERSGEAPATP